METKVELKNGQCVLVRNSDDEKWDIDIFRALHKNGIFMCRKGNYEQCIPYEGNEDYLDTRNGIYENGTFLISKDKSYIFILDAFGPYRTSMYAGLFLKNPTLGVNYGGAAYENNLEHYRLATKEEKQLLINALHEAKKEWNSDGCFFSDYVWKPEYGEAYYIPIWGVETDFKFKPLKMLSNGNFLEKKYIEKGICFRTQGECLQHCDKLNYRIKK